MEQITESCRVVVIGGGIAGASAAYALATEHGNGEGIVLLEREDSLAYHTTGRSAALFSEAYGGQVIRVLAKASRAFLEQPPQGFSGEPLLTPRGWLRIVSRHDQQRADQFYEESLPLVPDLQRLDSDKTLGLCPALSNDYVGSGVFEPRAMEIDVHALHYGFVKGFKALGGRIGKRTEVTALELVNGKWRVETSDRVFLAEVIVNAAGAWADELASMAGLGALELSPKRRTVVIFDPPNSSDSSSWPFTENLTEPLYFKPDAGSIFASPSDEIASPPCDSRPEEIDIATTIDRLERCTNFEIKHVKRKFAGLRSFFPDRVPTVGFDPRTEGFFWLAGQGGYGIKTSPALSRIAADLIVNRRFPSEISDQGIAESDLSPSRLI